MQENALLNVNEIHFDSYGFCEEQFTGIIQWCQRNKSIKFDVFRFGCNGNLGAIQEHYNHDKDILTFNLMPVFGILVPLNKYSVFSIETDFNIRYYRRNQLMNK
eukprot:UN08018